MNHCEHTMPAICDSNSFDCFHNSTQCKLRCALPWPKSLPLLFRLSPRTAATAIDNTTRPLPSPSHVARRRSPPAPHLPFCWSQPAPRERL
jgi:hypothetical protein